MINGQVVAGTVNLQSGDGILIGPCIPNTPLNRTDCTVTVDSTVTLSRSTDQAGTDHSINATSSPSGVTYAATMAPPLTNYTTGQWFIFTPDVTNLANATVNLTGTGPIPLKVASNGVLSPVAGGECSHVAPCLLIASGSPVSAFVVK